MNKQILKYAFVHATATFLYIVSVVWIMFNFVDKYEHVFDILIPILMLTLFVLSAGVTSSLVFGRPVLWYLDGKKKEAIKLLAWTLGFLLLIFLFILFFVIILNRFKFI